MSPNLTNGPFGTGPAAGALFFTTPALRECLITLEHRVCADHPLLVLLAPDGGGKSTLLEAFLHRAGPNWHVCYITSAHRLGLDELLKRLLTVLSVDEPFVDTQTGLGLLGSALSLVAERQERLILAIDDAHQLSDPILQFLAELASRSAHLKVSIALASRHDLLPRLVSFLEKIEEEEAWGQDFLYPIELPRFDEEQTVAYVQHRLYFAGEETAPSDRDLLTEARIREIHHQSAGSPGVINRLAAEVLAEGVVLDSEEEPSSSILEPLDISRFFIPWRRWLAGGIGAVGCLLVLFFTLSHFVTEDSVQPVPNLTYPPPVKQTEEGRGDADFLDETTPRLVKSDPLLGIRIDEGGQESIVPNTTSVVSPRASELPAEARTRPTISESTPLSSPSSSSSAGGAAKSSHETEPVITLSRESQGEDITIPLHQPLPLPSTTDRVRLPSAKQAVSSVGSSLEASEEPSEDSPAPRQPEDVVKATPPKSLSPAAPTLPKIQRAPGGDRARLSLGREWIDRQSADFYTIQLLSSPSLKTLVEFVEHQGLGQWAAAYRTIRKGRHWYGLIYGSYANRATALAAANKLKSAVGLKPWVRPFRDIQASLP